VAALSDTAGYPLLAEPTSQLRWGPYTPSAHVPGYDLIARARPEELAPELVLRVGDMPTSKALRQWLGTLGGLRQIVIDPSGDWKEPTRRAETLVRADSRLVAEGLAERLKAGSAARRDWPERWTGAQHAMGASVLRELESLDELSEPGVWVELASHLRDGDQVLAASSMPVRDQEAFLPPGRERVRFLSNRGANGIDGLVSTAAGLAADGARTWAVLGDLALVHDLGGLALAARTPRLRLLVLDNGGGGIFHFLPQADAVSEAEFEALLGTPPGLDLSAAAGLFGLSVATAANPDQLRGALAGDARVVIVQLDRHRNVEVHRRLSAVAASALASAA
jgi:2-succinyl-5-enolpyruvyl-6-hydroxy-3-cyclohexene-1-carboxylate synthase